MSRSDEPGWSSVETDNPLLADDRNFYKVEKWIKDGTKVDLLLYAGNNLERDIFVKAVERRPRIRLTIRQRNSSRGLCPIDH